VSGSNDCKIKVWSAASGTCLRTLAGHTAPVRALALDPARGRLVSAGYDRTVKVWDVRTGALLRELRGAHASHVFDVRFDARKVVSTSHDRRIVIADFGEGVEGADAFV
jgi:F-box and WD-40 domain protein 1/11